MIHQNKDYNTTSTNDRNRRHGATNLKTLKNIFALRGKRLAAFISALLFSCLLVNYVSIRDSISWHLQHELCDAASRGDIREMRLLIFIGAEADGWNTSFEPILSASWSGQTEAVQYLLDQGVNINSRDKFLWTPLMAASLGGHSRTVELLISRGANVNSKGDDGTALDLALGKKHQQVAFQLQQAGAKTSIEILNAGAEDNY